jgi:hypothetical protein
MGNTVDAKDLPPELRAALEAKAGLIPSKYEVYARALLLCREIPIQDGVWVANRLQRDFEKIIGEAKAQAKAEAKERRP